MRVALFCSVWLCSCAPAITAPAAVKAPDYSAMALQMAELQAKMRAAQALADQECAPLRAREVSWEEERTVGAELAVTYTAQHGHLYLDGVTEKDPQKLLNELSAMRPVSLPPGGKNAVSTHVAVVGRNLARFSGRPELPWVFGVIQNDGAHAFSTPGGFVFVTTGLLKKMTNEAQLAGVLAHEIAHVVQKDTLKKYVEARHQQCIAAKSAAEVMEHSAQQDPSVNAGLSATAKQFRGYATELELGKTDSAFVQFVQQTTSVLVGLGNEQDVEFATDRLALQLVSFAGYDAVQYEQFLTTWAQDKHPASADRAAKLEALRNGELRDFVHGTAKPALGDVFAPLSAP